MQDNNNLISPLQDWLLTRGKCVSCGRDLILQKKKRLNGHFLVTCECNKKFIFDPKQILFEKIEKLEINFIAKSLHKT